MIELFTTYNIIIGISVILNIVLLIGVRNLLRQNEQLEDTLVENNKFVQEKVQTSLDKMRELDNRQVFEKDDEVGATFDELKKVVDELNTDIK
jgi:hypothetical protein